MLLRALLLGKDPGLRSTVRSILEGLDIVVMEEPNPERLWSRLGQEAFDLVVTDPESLPAGGVEEIRNLPDRPETILLSTESDAGRRADHLAAGAFALVSPHLETDRLYESLKTIVSRFREMGLDRFRAEEQPRSALDDFSSSSPKMSELLRLARKVVSVDSSLLILGETGVGKEWLARAIHTEGPRTQAPFYAINCAAVPEALLESELFGHEKGAFTGAVRARRGAFELAHQGTLFLDEIGDLPVHLQVKLLRVLQERSIQRIGAESQLDVDVRIMAATNRDLQAGMERSEFRRDLFYRLSVVTLTVPPLRERRSDIPPLIENYLAQYKLQFGRERLEGIEETAVDAMRAYDWPGNVRELINVIERAVLLSDEEIVSLSDLPDEVSRCAETLEPGDQEFLFGSMDRWTESTLAAGRKKVLESFERNYLTSMLEKTRGQVGETAKRSGIEARTLYNKMKAYGLRKEFFR